jgi:hypothetical protein
MKFRLDSATLKILERAEAEGIDFEERSYENLVWFYQDELLKIQAGKSIKLLHLSEIEKKRLRRSGIIGLIDHQVLDKASKVLAQIMEEEDKEPQKQENEEPQEEEDE